MKRHSLAISFLLFLSLILSSSGFAQGFSISQPSPGNDGPTEEWRVFLSKTSDFQVGDEIDIQFKIGILQCGWHAYSVQPAPNGMGYNPTMFELDSAKSKGVELVGGMQEDQEPFVYFDELFEDSVKYFKTNLVTFTQKIKITEENPQLAGFLVYQICIDPEGGGMCRFPSLDVSFDFSSYTNPDEFGSEIPNCDNGHSSTNDNEDKVHVDDPNEPPKPPENGAWELIMMFLTSFGLGLFAVFTPCVFPMIPLTVSFFTKRSEKKGKGIRDTLLYGFFIIFIYTFFGILLSVIFGDDIWYKVSINPWVNLLFFGLLFVFALSFFGLFEITLPASISTKLDKGGDRGGVIGIFFMAAVLAVASFSCTGPLVGTALFEAAQGGRLGPTISMLGFSSAIALPFMLFAVFPGLMQKAPKSGGWLNSVKVVLGFIELALGMKFLSQADLYMDWHILDREIFLAGWIVIFGLMGLYLLGKIRLPHDSPVETLSVPRFMLAMASIMFVVYLIPGLWGAKLGFISGILPPPNRDIGVKLVGVKSLNEGTFNYDICTYEDKKYAEYFEEEETHGFCTFYDLDQAIEFAKAKKKPLFLDFTGHTCANCRMMEQNVWDKPKIASILKDGFVMVSLYADERNKLKEPEEIGEKTVTRIGDKWIEYQKIFGGNSQPQYVLFDPFEDKFDAAKGLLTDPVGYTPNELAYETFLKAGIKEFEKRHK